MSRFKLSYLWIFLVVLVVNKAHVSFGNSLDEKESVKKTQKIKQLETIGDQTPDEESSAKRKRRPRGIEVDVPQLAGISFVQYFKYTLFDPVCIREIYSFSEDCVHGKRGPPLV